MPSHPSIPSASRQTLSPPLPFHRQYGVGQVSVLQPRTRQDIDSSSPAHGLKRGYDCSSAFSFEQAAYFCYFKEDVTTAARTLLCEDLAPAIKATFDRVRAKFGAEDSAAVTTKIQDAIEANRARLAAESDGWDVAAGLGT